MSGTMSGYILEENMKMDNNIDDILIRIKRIEEEYRRIGEMIENIGKKLDSNENSRKAEEGRRYDESCNWDSGTM